MYLIVEVSGRCVSDCFWIISNVVLFVVVPINDSIAVLINPDFVRHSLKLSETTEIRTVYSYPSIPPFDRNMA